MMYNIGHLLDTTHTGVGNVFGRVWRCNLKGVLIIMLLIIMQISYNTNLLQQNRHRGTVLFRLMKWKSRPTAGPNHYIPITSEPGQLGN